MSRRSFRALFALLLVCLGLGASAAPATAGPVTIVGDPTAVTWGSGHMDVFARGSDGALWHRAFLSSMGGWGAWESLGGQITGNPTAVTWGQGHIDVFARGTDGGLHHRWFSNGWQPWSRIGTWNIQGSPDAVSWGYGHIDVFARGTDNALIHNATVPGMCTWCGWEHLGGGLTADPDAISWGKNHIDVFVRGGSGGLHHKWFGGAGWSSWEALGGGMYGKPSPVTWGYGHVDVFIRGTDYAMHHRAFMSNMCGWCPWESLGGTINSEPSPVAWPGQQRLNVHVRGTNDSVWERWFSGGWQPYWMLAGNGTFAGKPFSTSWGTGHLEVFGRTPGGNLWHRAYVNGWLPGESLGHPTDYGASARFGGSNVKLDTQAEIDAAVAYLDDPTTRAGRWDDFSETDRVTLAAHDIYVRWGETDSVDTSGEAGSYDLFDDESVSGEWAADSQIPDIDTYESWETTPVATDAAFPAVVGIVAGCLKFCDDAVKIGSKVVKAVKKSKPPRLPSPARRSPSWWVRNTGTRPREALRNNLQKDSVESAFLGRSGWAAHHIVPIGHRHARIAQQYLANCNIMPNSTANGVMLPTSSVPVGDRAGRQLHGSIHTNHYFNNLNRSLFASTATKSPLSSAYCEAVRQVLGSYKDLMQKGKLLH